jgi:2-polyprenyl-3-methyl-5-hydroxy-6-metoxy-1,4-benzoquinol methylase
VKRLDRLAQNWRIDKARQFIAKGNRVLDIGCADGALFQRLGNLIGEGVGLDPDMGEREVGANFHLLKGMFPADLPDDRPFDVITMLAVLEHIPRDQQTRLARACAQSLAPGGRLIITVPSGAVDPIASALTAAGLADGMSLEQHYGFKSSELVPLFTGAGLELLARKRFQLGLNNLFVFRAVKTTVDQGSAVSDSPDHATPTSGQAASNSAVGSGRHHHTDSQTVSV